MKQGKKKSSVIVEVQAQDARWKAALRPYRKTVLEACEAALLEGLRIQDSGFKGKTGHISVMLAKDRFIQDLNKTFRGQNKPTNVLSFEGDGDHLGDIVMALETVKCEAKEQQKTVRAHAQHLLVHGVLHLLGYDHMRPKEANIMERLEIKILKKLKVDNPYL